MEERKELYLNYAVIFIIIGLVLGIATAEIINNYGLNNESEESCEIPKLNNFQNTGKIEEIDACLADINNSLVFSYIRKNGSDSSYYDHNLLTEQDVLDLMDLLSERIVENQHRVNTT